MPTQRRPRTTPGGSPIAYRRTYAHANKLDGTPFLKPEELPLAIVKAKNGVTYEIPIDIKTGKVLTSALYERFLDINNGSRNGRPRNIGIDHSTLADVVHIIPKGSFTPEELIKTGWWQHPNESDILGIDDPSSDFLKGWIQANGKENPIGNRIAVITTPKEQQRIQGVLMDNFTKKELKDAVKNGGIVFKVANPGPDASGYYRPLQQGVNTPVIVLEPNSSEDTITHEFVHHLRHIRSPDRPKALTTPYPMDERGYLDPAFSQLPSETQLAIRNLEEGYTVAEATARTRKEETRPTGYYKYTDGSQSSVGKYRLDREMLERARKDGTKTGRRGKNATTQVVAKFPATKISTLRYEGGASAIEYAKELDYYDKDGKAVGGSKPKAPKKNVATANTGFDVPEMPTSVLGSIKGRSRAKAPAKPKTTAKPKSTRSTRTKASSTRAKAGSSGKGKKK